MKSKINKQFFLTMLFYAIIIFSGISTLFFLLGGFSLKDIALLLFQVFTLSLLATIFHIIYNFLSEQKKYSLIKLISIIPVFLVSSMHYFIITLLYEGDEYVFFSISWFFYSLIIPIGIYLSYFLYLKYTEIVYNNQLKKIQNDLNNY